MTSLWYVYGIRFLWEQLKKASTVHFLQLEYNYHEATFTYISRKLSLSDKMIPLG